MENKKLELMTQDLSAGYDGKTIVSDVSITIPKNKISVILGANGCGKSTLLKTFAKLLKPEQGKHSFGWKKHFFNAVKADGADARTSSAVTNRARRD